MAERDEDREDHADGRETGIAAFADGVLNAIEMAVVRKHTDNGAWLSGFVSGGNAELRAFA